ncbi:MAG: restriction endonuclease subunit S [Syntrophomonas sp.]
MAPNHETILNTFYQRGIISRDQLLTEVLRVRLTLDIVTQEGSDKLLKNSEKLFQLMKQQTEDELGFFPGDRDFFAKIFELCRDVDLIDITLDIYKNDRSGMVISPKYLTEFVCLDIDESESTTLLITEAEKHLSGIRSLADKYSNKQITFTTSYPLMYKLLNLSFRKYKNISIFHQSIYQKLLLDKRFDFIFCLPAFTSKAEGFDDSFISQESEGIAIENMLSLLSEHGILLAIVPAKITFAGGSIAKLRNYIVENYSLDRILMLPEGTFRPYTAIKTYILNISNTIKDTITIGTVEYENELFSVSDQKAITRVDFLKHEDWRIEIILAEDNENIKKFRNSNLKRVKLKDVAEVFRGKSILKKDVLIGKIAVLNISDIENGEIDYTKMDTIDDDERKVKRYELVDGDVVLTCRGTAIKTAVFAQQDRMIIASANIIVIRPQEQILGAYIKIFFESPVGLTLIKSFQRGTNIMNINHSDIMELEIPLLPISQQMAIVEKYEKELQLYKETLNKAERRWQEKRDNLYQKLY